MRTEKKANGDCTVIIRQIEFQVDAAGVIKHGKNVAKDIVGKLNCDRAHK